MADTTETAPVPQTAPKLPYEERDHGPGTFVQATESLREAARALCSCLPDNASWLLADIEAKLEVLVGKLTDHMLKCETCGDYYTLQRQLGDIADYWKMLNHADSSLQASPPKDQEVHALWRNYCQALRQLRAMLMKTLQKFASYRALPREAEADLKRNFAQLPIHIVPEERKPAQVSPWRGLNAPPVGAPDVLAPAQTTPPPPPAAKPPLGERLRKLSASFRFFPRSRRWPPRH